ncbi:ribonuclease H-like domain-containing protein [Candidatus Leptofilum sp.]|uniref:ribonuclease H-like domain-containing protein n=1 Tax=Candidatus Leptofilum sp. TaxID=3241576 RepID=UPI003B5910C9
MADKNNDLQAKLRRLGMVRGARQLKTPRTLKPAPPVDETLLRPFPTPRSPKPFDDDDIQPLEKLLPGGQLVSTPDGDCFVLDQVYNVQHQHGDDRLADLLAFTPAAAAPFVKDDRLTKFGFRDFLFLDTETTGLAGAGTLAFMVGVGFFEPGARGERFVVRQYFLRDHGDEPAMLLLLDELLAQKAGLVTFNGRSFDIPLLEGRFIMNRLPTDLAERPHFDLLHPARRLWRHRLGSCALSSLEGSLLGLRRSQEDVPGWLIPSLYNQYLRSGDARELVRVFYHNEIDMVSMVTLAARVTRLLHQPDPGDHPIDLYSLGRWQADLGLTEAAEQNFRLAAQGELPLELYHQNLHRLALLLKRNGRAAEALPLWQQIAATSFDDVTAHEELAKYYEWQAQELDQALIWTEQALNLVGSWGRRQQQPTRAELEHRHARLQRKLKTQ